MKILFRLSAICLFLYLPCQAHAWDHKRVKVDAGINARFNVYVVDEYKSTLAPWYTYWPVEAAYPPPPQPGSGMYFPTWPGTWPPAGANSKNAPAPKGPATSMAPPGDWQPPAAAPVPPNMVQSQPPYSFQPVGYFNQTPGYWYGR